MAHAVSKKTDLDLDLEKAQKGDGAQGISLLLLVIFVHSPKCKEENRPKELQPKLPPPPQEESRLDDSSRTIFSVYSKLSEEEDTKMTERWQKNAEGILIFVSLYVDIHTFMRINWHNCHRRPVYSLQLSQHYWECPSKT
jgi:hypothetical protein